MKTPFTIRQATVDDAQALVPLMAGLVAHLNEPPAEIAAEALARDLLAPEAGFCVLVAEAQEGLIGYALDAAAFDRLAKEARNAEGMTGTKKEGEGNG